MALEGASQLLKYIFGFGAVSLEALAICRIILDRRGNSVTCWKFGNRLRQEISLKIGVEP